MQTQLSCPLCNFEYCEQKTPRILSMCGHTFCETCIETMILPQEEEKFKIICPEDETACELPNNTIKQFPVNKALMKIIESNKSKSSFKDSSFDVSKIVKQEQLQEDQDTKQLISAIQQSQQQEIQKTQKSEATQAPIFETNNTEAQTNNNTANTAAQNEESSKKVQSEQSEEEDDMCLLHQKPLEIVCVVDLEKICSKCAIFGKHKGHQFRSIEQIEQQNNSFYQELLAVYDQKTEIMNRVEKKETKIDLLSILNANKQSLVKQVRERFKKLIDTIKAEQKKALTKLQKISQKIEKEIDDLYNIDAPLVQKYEEWQRLSFQKLQIIQKGTFEEKLRLLLIDQAKKENNIIIQGKNMVNQIKAQEDSIINKAEVMLTNINMKTNDKIFQFTEGFVEIFDKPPEIPKVEVFKQNHPSANFKESSVFDSGKKHSEEDLLEIQDHGHDLIKEQNTQQYPSNFSRNTMIEQGPKIEELQFVPVPQIKYIEEKPIQRPQTKRNMENFSTEKRVQLPQEVVFQSTTKEDSFALDKVVRPTKKKLKSIKVPEKYEKILQGLFTDNTQTLDLTNAQLGDNVILQICEFIPGTKIKTIKFIRNKLTDDCVLKMLPYISNAITLNLSQNMLTERVLDIFVQNRELLPKVKNIILSLNKIIERKHKGKIDEVRKLDITVSV